MVNRIAMLFLFIVFCLSSSLYAQLWVVDPLEAIYPDSNNIESWDKNWASDFIVDTDISCHIVVKVPKNKPYKLIGHVNGEEVFLSELVDVPVEQNTGIDSRTEQYKGIKNRSEEHTSELQSRGHLVCRLLLE